MKRLALLVATCCSSRSPLDAPPSEPVPDALQSCASVTQSSCDGGYAACDLNGACVCFRGIEAIACDVPCIMPPVRTCRSLGCDEHDTYECRWDTGDCWCVKRGNGGRVECELDGCG